MQLPSLPAAVSASLPAAEGVTMEATVTLEMMVMENVPVNLAETVLPLESFAEMPALERHAEMPILVFDHPTLGQCSTYPIGCSHEWLLLVSSPPSPPGILSSSISQPWHTCSTPTLIYPAGQKGPVFPHFRQILCLFLFLFTSLLK